MNSSLIRYFQGKSLGSVCYNSIIFSNPVQSSQKHISHLRLDKWINFLFLRNTCLMLWEAKFIRGESHRLVRPCFTSCSHWIISVVVTGSTRTQVRMSFELPTLHLLDFLALRWPGKRMLTQKQCCTFAAREVTIQFPASWQSISWLSLPPCQRNLVKWPFDLPWLSVYFPLHN